MANGMMTKDMTADLVVVGAGGSGLSAAVAAAEAGSKRILVLEKRPTIGGNTAMAYGMFAADSPAQKRVLVDAPKDEMFKRYMELTHWKTNPRLVRAFIGKTAGTISWLEDMGVRFQVKALWMNQSPPTMHVPDGYGEQLMRILAKEAASLGVVTYLETSGERLLLDGGGRVCGIAVRHENQAYTISAKAVILGTGGFGGNKRMLEAFCPDYRNGMECIGIPAMGDGINMAVSAGADTEGLGLLHLSGPSLHTYQVLFKVDLNPPQLFPLMGVALEPNTIWLNRNGERFADEAVGSDHFMSCWAAVRQPDNVTYTVFDTTIAENMIANGMILGMGNPGKMGVPLTGFKAQLREQAKKGSVIMADSLGELAETLRLDAEALNATVREYNAFCARGHDGAFVKDPRYLDPLVKPPYYAIPCRTDFLSTIGGVRINESMEAVGRDGQSIPGLYVVGIDAGGWEKDYYCAAMSGSAFGFAVNSGRIAGENAARYIEVCR